jgi:hypothetical protein
METDRVSPVPQLDWIEHGPGRPHFNGVGYDPAMDDDRLSKQLGRVWAVMRDGRWRSLAEIRADIAQRFAVEDPEASISAQLRHLRKPRFGQYDIERRRRACAGTWEYRLNA